MVLTAQQVKALQRRNAQLEEENLILKKPLQSSRHTQTTIRICPGAFQPAPYLHSLPGTQRPPQRLLPLHKRQPSAREQENQRIRQKILEIYAKTGQRLGCRKIKLCLARDFCISISESRVYRLMKEMNLPKMSTVKPPRPPKQPDDPQPFQNLLAQKFDQPAPNLVWVCDFTYVRVGQRFCYLCVILDLFARRVIAYRISTRLDRFLALHTLRDAVRNRGVSQGVMFHSDRGAQFTSADFRKELDSLHMVPSFSRKGHPYDNAVMECFFKYLKKRSWIGGIFILWTN